ncbi:hypothetical protein Pla52o_38420 [Novipirellula galeiformis]|uniref:RNA polymerase sigma factor RpoE n=1 Tax=Novipirellula galeiformis TaxID=2528004 RepID=A0A5C6CCA3_9BACT|nr:sigma-70 family RNA polymerase sigma factor [Novipirellula galeiformis]TWU21655.1 hypothetical protein Pla52o_38420 [Novipirellula galeiformis]
MTPWPTPNPLLISDLSDPANDAAWHRFDALYRPLIYRFARRRGLDHHGAEEVVSDVIRRVARVASRWNRAPGEERSCERPPQRFAAWLNRVSRNSLVNVVCRDLSHRGIGGTTHQITLESRPAATEDARSDWENDRQRILIRLAADAIRSDFDEPSWDAFWSSHVEGESIDRVAQRLGKSRGAIYAIRSRIVRRLREEVRQIEAAEDRS